MGRKKIYEVEIKSQSLLREGKKGLITYFVGGETKVIASNVRKLYPKYTKPKDKPVVLINEIKQKDYNKMLLNGVTQKSVLLKGNVDINEIMGD